MLRTKVTWSSLSLLMLLAAPGVAQERVATAGRVLGKDGKPVANATVRFVGSEPPIGDRFGSADSAEVVTNDKGRFQIQLRDRFEYSCWAIGPANDGATRAISEVADARPGSGFELTLSSTATARRIAVAGTEAWAGHGQLRFEVALDLAHLRRVPLELVDGATTLPLAPPGCSWLLFVRDAAGSFVWGERVEAGSELIDMQMPAPHTIPVRVVDEHGQPVADATILAQASQPWRSDALALTPPPLLGEWSPCGRTGADGTAQIVVPCRVDPLTNLRAGGPMLLACKAGHAGALSGWNGLLIVDGKCVTELAKPELSFTLRAAPSFRGRLLGADGKPMAGMPVGLSGSCVMELLHESMLRSPSMFTTTTAADGTFCFESLPPFEAPVLHVPSADPRLRAPALLTPTLDRAFEFDARQLAMVDLKVLDVDGGPARNADVVLMPSPVTDHQLDATTWRCRLDSRGTARLHVQPGDWSILVTDRRGFARISTTLRGTIPVELQLVALPVLRGVVHLQADEDPKAVRLFINGINHGGPNPPEPVATRRAAGTRLNRWFAERTSVGADGTFELPFLDVPGTTYKGGVGLGKRRAQLSLHATTEPIEFDLR